MNKTVYKYKLSGQFICSYKNIAQAARDFEVDESTIRKPLNESSEGFIVFRGFILSYNNSSRLPEIKRILPKGPKVLILDIETAPIKGYVWGTFKQNIYTDQIIRDWYLISWAAKWLFEPDTFGDVQTVEEALNESDERIVTSLWEVLNDADIVIAHNGKEFDIKKINTRFLFHKMAPPKTFQLIDTLIVARDKFGISRNNLDYVCEFLGLPRKKPTEFKLWLECMAGNQDALNYMFEYNQQDIASLEEVYVRFRPFISSHPNLALYTESSNDVCPRCGHDLAMEHIGTYSTLVNTYDSYRCVNCGGISRSQHRTTPDEKKITYITK